MMLPEHTPGASPKQLEGRIWPQGRLLKSPELYCLSVCFGCVGTCVYTGEGLFYSERDVFVMAAQLSSGDV